MDSEKSGRWSPMTGIAAQRIGVGPNFFPGLLIPCSMVEGVDGFRCYGRTCSISDGQPATVTVTAITQQLKPKIYPRVDDEATIIRHTLMRRDHPGSWNWPAGRKDLEITVRPHLFTRGERSHASPVGDEPEKEISSAQLDSRMMIRSLILLPLSAAGFVVRTIIT